MYHCMSHSCDVSCQTPDTIVNRIDSDFNISPESLNSRYRQAPTVWAKSDVQEQGCLNALLPPEQKFSTRASLKYQSED